MLNHNRGLWGYTGTAHDGEPLTVQATGMGGPSAAIVAEELVQLGARRLLRVGTCGALDGGLALGSLLAVAAALPEDGASRALGARPAPLPADPAMLTALDAPSRARSSPPTSSTTPTPVAQRAGAQPERSRSRWRRRRCSRVAAHHGLPAACVLVV